MDIRIEGFDFPGRTFSSSGDLAYTNVRVGIQIGQVVEQVVAGDTHSATWTLSVRVKLDQDGQLDFAGPGVHGKRGERFLYLSWGNSDGMHFAMFRRAKLMMNDLGEDLIRRAESEQRPLIARIRLRDERGEPRCARVKVPDIEWSLG